MTRRRIALAALLAALLAVAVGLATRQTGGPPPVAAPATAAAGKGTGPRVVVTAPGRVEPASEEREIASELRAVLRVVHVEEGDIVRAGQVLAELAGDEFRARVRQARAAAGCRRCPHLAPQAPEPHDVQRLQLLIVTLQPAD